MLLEADWVLPVGRPPLARGAVVVANGAIVAVGPAEELGREYPAEEVRPFPGCALLPGLVNAHTHLEYSAFRAFTGPCGFGEWMLRLLMARQKLVPQDYAVSAMWGAFECVRGGVTSIADASFEGWTTARAARSAGLRARVYLEVFGLDDAELAATLGRLESRLAGLQSECGPLMEVGISPHAPYTVSSRLYREVVRIGRRRSFCLATHVAESLAEVELLEHGTGAITQAYRAANLWRGQSWKSPGLSPVAFLAENQVLGRRTLAIHCVQVSDADVAVLARTGTPVAHCPRSNLRLQCGSAPVAELRNAGITVGLGTDSLASNESLDMFAEMRAAIAASRVTARPAPARGGSAGGNQGPAAAGLSGSGTAAGAGAAPGESAVIDGLTSEDALRMATLDGASALGWEHLVGSLESGKRADIIAVRLSARPSAGGSLRAVGSSLPDPVEAVVSEVTADDVVMTMVDGAVIYDASSGREAALTRTHAPADDAGCLDVERDFIAVRAKLGLNDSE